MKNSTKRMASDCSSGPCARRIEAHGRTGSGTRPQLLCSNQFYASCNTTSKLPGPIFCFLGIVRRFILVSVGNQGLHKHYSMYAARRDATRLNDLAGPILFLSGSNFPIVIYFYVVANNTPARKPRCTSSSR